MSKKPGKFKKKKNSREKKVVAVEPKKLQIRPPKRNDAPKVLQKKVTLSLKKDFHKIFTRNFFEFFVESFLMTGILLLLVTIFTLLIRIQSVRLTQLSDSYIVHDFPNATSKVAEFSDLPAYIVYSKDSGTIVDGRNFYYRFSPASTAKVMTALVSLEHYDLNTVLTSRNLFAQQSIIQGSRMGLIEDEQMSVRNLLYGLLLPSGNDAAFVLAENYPGGVAAFVAAMNEKAAELKLESTHFQDPAGFDDNNYTTAFDLARLTSVALDNQVFKTIVDTKEKTVYNNTYTVPHDLSNLNTLLGLDGVNGVKTGFTNEAGGVLITSDVHQGKTYIIIVMKSNDRFGDTQKILSDVVDTITLVTY